MNLWPSAFDSAAIGAHVYTHVVDGGNTECEARWDRNTQSDGTILTIGADWDTRASFSEELGEGNSDGGFFS